MYADQEYLDNVRGLFERVEGIAVLLGLVMKELHEIKSRSWDANWDRERRGEKVNHAPNPT